MAGSYSSPPGVLYTVLIGSGDSLSGYISLFLLVYICLYFTTLHPVCGGPEAVHYIYYWFDLNYGNLYQDLVYLIIVNSVSVRFQ